MLSSRYYPRSFTVLVIVAMIVLTVPLTSGLINAIRVLQGIAETQRQFATDSLAVTRDTRTLLDATSQLQRAAGQYHLLQDAELGPALQTRHDALQTLLADLSPRLTDAESHATLTRLRGSAQALYRRTRPGTFLDSTSFRALDSEFNALHDQARTLLEQSDAAIQHRMRALEDEVRSTQRRLMLLALALIPLTLLLAAVFSWMINRPIRQLRASIQQLGRGDHAPLPALVGPQDMVELGREMDWLRQRLQALEDQKIRFLRHVSHELKTPLASLREGVGLLDDTLAGPLNPRQRDIVRIMDGSGRELQKRIEDLIRVGNLAINPVPATVKVALEPLLQSVLARQRLPLDTRGLTIDLVTAPFTLHTDATRLETALDNLLSNAIKFSPEGGRILIEATRLPDATLAIDVCDAGPGIPVADRTRVFEAFFQGAHQPAVAVKGSGLGLAIVRESMRSLGGDASLIEREAWSTCFRLTCPVSPSPTA
ncbi:MAG: two-component sensor histidine kinase [Hydrogenophilales bacterium 16-64-46]|nr:MAG: two-component sensor histidine kinase [Hydrogenophilales bacterium 12-64-13]OYZ06738.1 MAG: two-component sensor histidine kinase [Hydrogenophilales bacterium 16-64-46]OZA39446.1 MAG: two-component sensor histidine kinase [Hydrogenophilales bacterium 17-64-34]HQT01206.1 ATP-binding protein [Thiobacillus sp.]